MGGGDSVWVRMEMESLKVGKWMGLVGVGVVSL